MLRFGPDDGPVVIAAPALFEEGNRTRAFLVRILRLLAERGVASALPDLPGQGESLVATVDARLEHWRAAFAAVVAAQKRAAVVFAIRGGSLVDTDADAIGRYQLAPVGGAAIFRDLDRARRLAYPGWDDVPSLFGVKLGTAPGIPNIYAGNRLDSALIEALLEAEPSAADRVTRLTSDPAAADLKLDGRPLWRASEPGVDEPLAIALADDIASWVRRCAA